MKVKIADENKEAEELIPPAQRDGSGVGVNYADAYIKGIKCELEDGRKVVCKRRGLKITMAIGDKKGEALLRRWDHGPDVRNILQEALKSATQEAGATFSVEGGAIFLDVT